MYVKKRLDFTRPVNRTRDVMLRSRKCEYQTELLCTSNYVPKCAFDCKVAIRMSFQSQTLANNTTIQQSLKLLLECSSQLLCQSHVTLTCISTCRFMILHTYINSRLFPMGIGRNYRTPPATILTYSSRLVHIFTSDHARTLAASMIRCMMLCYFKT